jgi:HAD superfamily hydrolase (TIGR01549 family)
MLYKAILFDLDDTLYDLRSYWSGRLHQALDDILARYAHFDRDTLIRLAIAEKVYIERLPAFLRSQGVDDETVIAAAQEIFQRDWFARLVLYDDAAHTLEALRGHFKLGLVTNGPSRTQRPKIEQFKLADYFDLIIVSEEVGVAKPEPAIFKIALDRLGVAAHETLFVGDSPEFDLRGAAAAGMPFVWMNPRHETLPTELPRPIGEIERLHQLLPLVSAASEVIVLPRSTAPEA